MNMSTWGCRSRPGLLQHCHSGFFLFSLSLSEIPSPPPSHHISCSEIPPLSYSLPGSLISSRTLTSPFPSLSRSWPKSRLLPKSGDLSGREHAVCHLDTFHFPLNNALQLANAWHCTNRCLTSTLYSAPARRNQLVFETRPRSGSVVRLRGLATTCAGTSYPPPPPPPDLDLTQPCLSGWAGDQQVISIHDPKIAIPVQKSMRMIYL